MPSGFEPIVVDNGSGDGSGALAARLAVRDGPARGQRRMAHRRGGSDLRPPEGRPIEGHRIGQGHRLRGQGHGGGARAAMTLTLAVIAKAPAPGRSKTRLCPPLSLVQAARLAEGAPGGTLEAGGGNAPGPEGADPPRPPG